MMMVPFSISSRIRLSDRIMLYSYFTNLFLPDCAGKIIPFSRTMPLFYQQAVDSETKLAIWKIEEEEQFFLDHVPLQREITHPHKRLQHLAGRYLLQFLFPDFPIRLIQIADTRKPFLEDEAYHFSI